MPLEDYLMPDENIKFQSDLDVQYGDKLYNIVLTDTRLVLYSRRGLLFKSDDVVTEAIKDIKNLKYKEEGMFVKKAYLIIESKSKIVLSGDRDALKTLYQRLLPFLLPELRHSQTSHSPMSSAYPQELISRSDHAAPRFCPECGIELAPHMRFCHNCGKKLS
jgi:hypothetical protein